MQQPSVVVHAFNPSIQEAETGISVSLRPAWSTESVPGQSPKLHRETLSRKTNKKEKKKERKVQIDKCTYPRASLMIPFLEFGSC